MKISMWTSFIFGHTRCVAIKSSSDLSPKEGCIDGTTDNSCSIHYSNKVFTSTVIKSGDEVVPTHDGKYNMIGNDGNGYAKITIIN